MPSSKPHQTPIAIIGLGCIFADSPDHKAFLHLLTRGVCAISDPPETHAHLRPYLDPDPKKPDHIYCNRGGFLPEVDFDPTEFGIPPSVIEATDTSQLLGLLVARQALADAGYGGEKTFDRARTSVILGVTGTQELVIPLGARLGHPIWRQALADAGVPEETARDVMDRIADGYVGWQENSFPGLLGNVVAGRIANRFDLGGTNCVLDAACASSMGAIHTALMELTTGRAEMVITGGVDTINDAFMHMCFSRTQILSPSGRIRPFSQEADGTLLGEGVGMVVLKRLADAQRDGDRIYAVIKGIGAGSDGKSQSIYAPRVSGQVAVLRQAYAQAGVTTDSVAMVEAHGTGTRVGDEVEFRALCEVFGQGDGPPNRCALGSVKSNIGHTKAAAGTAGLIKATLALYHKVLPPTLNAQPADPKLGVADSPFYINHTLRPWLADTKSRRRAGVSAFGFGGSNFHAVLEEYDPLKTEPSWDGAVEIAAFCADSGQALATRLRQWAGAIESDARADAIARSAAESRGAFQADAPWRATLVIAPAEGAARLHRQCDVAADHLDKGRQDFVDPKGHIYIGSGSPTEPPVFLFPGQGSQYVGMGRDLTAVFPEALAALQEAEAHFDGEHPLSDLLYPRMPDAADHDQQLRHTAVAQPAIGAVSAAALAVLQRFGIAPTATCGHSYGELVALHAAGRFDRPSLWRLSVARGQAMAAAGECAGDAGAMSAVTAPLQDLAQMVQSMELPIVLANRNSPAQGVLSGATVDIDAAETLCREKGWRTVRLPVAAAFHSRLVAAAQAPFQQAVDQVDWQTGTVPVMSNTRGDAYPADAAAARALLGGQLAHPVDFVGNIENMYAGGARTFIEVGPKSVLTRLVTAILGQRSHTTLALDSSAGQRFGVIDLAAVLAHLGALGYPVRLDRWETPLPPARTLRMRIPLSGANYRRPRPAKPVTPPLPKEPATEPRVKHAVASAEPTIPTSRPTLSAAPPNRPTPLKTTGAAAGGEPRTSHIAADHRARTLREPMDDNRKARFNQILAGVQQGLAAMQSLQSQTTQAHQKYLETQAEAHRTLQQMLRSTQYLASVEGTALSEQEAPPARARHFSEPAAAFQAAEAPMSEAFHSGATPRQASGHARNPSVADPVPPQAPADKVSPQKAPTQTASTGAVDATLQDNLLQIVSELTGYPVEMLGLEMDIESDLGIDSIKRVEILSTLEERMPHLPKVTPDMVGTLKTLGRICEYLTADGSAAMCIAQTGSTAAEAPPTAAAVSNATADVQHCIVDIVSELTGYPVEMLGLEMDIEADLGIDSIKRVEILSTLEERMPHLPKVTPDMVGTLKTLGQICAYLTTGDGTATAGTQSGPTTAEAATTAAAGGAAAADVQHCIVDIVSELTGYPAEMLGLEMDIEADLGIDSIKRVEILSTLEERMPHLPKVTPDMVGTLKTLGQICEYLSDGRSGIDTASDRPAALSQTAATAARPTDVETAEQASPPTTAAPVPCLEIATVALPPLDAEPRRPAPDHGKIAIVAPGNGPWAEQLAAAFADDGWEALIVEDRNRIADTSGWAGLVLVAPINPLEAFLWAKGAAPRLQQAALQGHAFFHTVTWLDGAFGFTGQAIDDPEQGGLAGLAKTAALEWPAIRCGALDVDPRWTDPASAAKAAVSEMLCKSTGTTTEVGLSDKGRTGLQQVTAAPRHLQTLSLASEDVVVVTGGARGVTAASALALAQRTPCTLALLGRSPQPIAEPDWLAPLTSEGEMKQVLLQHAEGPLTPKDLESTYRQWIANREITNTLDRCRKAGIRAAYFSLDVRDAAAVTETLAEIRQTLGPVKGLIHGAGVLADRLIAEKSAEQFQQVYATKVEGLRTLLAATQQDELHYLVLFSSVSARCGNPGQVDYAMANETLNKIAQQQARLRPRCKVTAINWGPWDGGMVSPALKRNFLAQGVQLIPVDQGAAAMVAEMGHGDAAAVEVVIGAGLPAAAIPPAQATAPVAAALPEDVMVQAARREIDVDRCPVLQSHQLNGRPVVPLALMTEWLAHGALHANPGLVLHGIDHLRLLKGITLDRSPATIRLMAGRPRRKDGIYEVDVEIRNDGRNGNGVVHTRATALLAEQLPPPPGFIENGHFKGNGKVQAPQAFYQKVLFHGDALHGIERIIRLADDGMTATIRSAPVPAQWLTDPLRSRWIGDPLVLDGAFQMAIIWCHEQRRQLCLPSYAATYRQYREKFPTDQVTVVLTVTAVTDRKMTGDFDFLDAKKEVVARLTGYEAIMDPGLANAFQR
ncbi:type I polyketide synthase [Desulfatitalea alkaliphila]|uniref:SDR family NAD(P)-dependent oxidoreductase n=1 Tax=Desulfatitalea alkaliphila TaxID=2929485 RepID=A0AA41R772_9BACT|nr:type I polyketide synthase [Desulfatitalea alkaliphila]MCJ8502510.1 SDR family NAD(P)-dependent oxidoreductase [Desulfatitalea alkaliphila]